MLPPPRTLKSWLVVGGGLAGFWLMTFTASRQLGATFDEPGHITSGYAYWKFGDFRINAENGMLGTRTAAAPLLNLNLAFPSRESEAWRQPNARALAGSFFFELGNDFNALLRRARAANALFGVLLVALVWAWARQLFGSRGGWLALGLAAFSPTVLAHSGLATSDVVVTTCFLLAVSSYWRLWHVVTGPRIALAGIAAGATFLSKTSGVLLVPMLGVLLVVRLFRASQLRVQLGSNAARVSGRSRVLAMLLGTSCATGLIAFGMIWAGYQFRYAAAPFPSGLASSFDPPWEKLLQPGENSAARASAAGGLIEDGFKTPMPPAIARTVTWLRVHGVLPEAYLWSVAFTFQASRSRPSFFWGESSESGSRWFFPAAFLLKTTPAELALGLAGFVALGNFAFFAFPPAGLKARRFRIVYRATPLFVLFVVYGLTALSTPLNIGHRHILPLYPVVFILAGATAAWIHSKHRIFARGLIGVAIASQVYESVAIRPFYLSYFTTPLGDQGWKYLVDSSYDWGQGLPALERWLADRRGQHDETPVFLSYFGSDSPRARQLAVTRVADWRDDSGPRNYPAPLRGGWYAISATNFQRVYLGIAGPWSPFYEQRYQAIGNALPKDQATAARLTATERAEWVRLAMVYEILQFGRLCHFLRDRVPAEIVGASILIFRVTDEELKQALATPLSAGPVQLNGR